MKFLKHLLSFLFTLSLFYSFIFLVSATTSITNDLSPNILSGLQGGQAGEFYHLNQSLFNRLVSYAYLWITGDNTLLNDTIYLNIYDSSLNELFTVQVKYINNKIL